MAVTLRAVLANPGRHLPRARRANFHSLEVVEWSSSKWTIDHTLLLIRVCHKFKVEDLFYEASFNDRDPDDWAEQPSPTEWSPFLYDLREIQIRIGIHEIPMDMSIMFSRSRVRKLVFHLCHTYSYYTNRLNKHIVPFKQLERTRVLDENYSLLSFSVWLHGGRSAPLNSAHS
uniref:Uncharacterized protein n=1 Tax=viral metagenome TaxID=1070528 RepID=A0A6C0CIY5_9ZZZZ